MLFKLKRVWKYCSYNIPFFVFILILMCFLNWFYNEPLTIFRTEIQLITLLIILFFLSGYGMLITRDRINHGYRLPKIMLKEVFSLGIKSLIIFYLFSFVQVCILGSIASHLNFPMFDLEHMLIHYSETINLLFSHDALNTIIFLSISAVVFYVLTFFTEMSLAELADSDSLVSAFNFKVIFKRISLFGWKNYTKDITVIILLIVVLSYIKSITIPFFWINCVWEVFFSFLMYVTQFLGIGAVYCEIKDKEQELMQSKE